MLSSLRFYLVYIYMCVYIYIYIYIHIERERERERERARGNVVVEALCYKQKVAGSRHDEVMNFFILPNPSSRTRP
jgi:hypothetical protein